MYYINIYLSSVYLFNFLSFYIYALSIKISINLHPSSFSSPPRFERACGEPCASWPSAWARYSVLHQMLFPSPLDPFFVPIYSRIIRRPILLMTFSYKHI